MKSDKEWRASVEEIAMRRIPAAIYEAHCAMAVYVAIGKHAVELNKSHFRNTSFHLSRHALVAMVLPVCAIYERPSCKNYSIPTALKILQENIRELPDKPVNPHILDFIRRNLDSQITSSDGSRLFELLINYFEDTYPRKKREDNEPPGKFDAVLDALKVLRDKRMAHYEATDISAMNKTPLKGVRELLAYAQSFVDIIGCGLFSFSNSGCADSSRFQPEKSPIWREMNTLVEVMRMEKSRK